MLNSSAAAERLRSSGREQTSIVLTRGGKTCCRAKRAGRKKIGVRNRVFKRVISPPLRSSNSLQRRATTKILFPSRYPVNDATRFFCQTLPATTRVSRKAGEIFASKSFSTVSSSLKGKKKRNFLSFSSLLGRKIKKKKKKKRKRKVESKNRRNPSVVCVRE